MGELSPTGNKQQVQKAHHTQTQEKEKLSAVELWSVWLAFP